MNLPILAFFVRALRVGCRNKKTYALRLLLSLVTLCYLIGYHLSSAMVGAPGLGLFRVILWIDLVFVFLLGLGYFAGAIAEEREQKSLGLLKMTGLSPLSILLGKSTSRMLEVMLLVLVQLPFVLLAVTLGGVAPIQIAAGFCTILAWTVMLSGLGLLCSVCVTRTDNAAAVMGLVITVFLFAPSIGGLLQLLDPAHLLSVIGIPCAEALTAASPFVAAAEITETGFSGPIAGTQALSNLGAGVLLFLLSWAVFERLTWDEREAAARGQLRTRGRRQLRIGRAATRALVWKDFHFVAGGILVILIKLSLYGTLAIIVIWASGASFEIEVLSGTIMVVTMIAGIIQLAWLTQRSIQSELQGRTLSTLMLLPLGTRRMLLHKLLGCAQALIPELLFFIMAAALAPDILVEMFSEMPIMVFLYFAAQLALILHLVAFYSLILKRAILGLVLLTWLLIQTITTMLASIVMVSIRFASTSTYLFLHLTVCVILIVLLHQRIIKGIRAKAAEG
jgi:hypothetical protein